MHEELTKGLIKFHNVNSPIQFVHNINIDKPENHHLHINRFYEIYVYVKGDADYIVDNTYFSLKKGDIIVINQYKPHTVLIKNTSLYERFYMLIPIDAFDNFAFNPLKELTHTGISLPDKERKQALTLLYDIKEIFDKPKSDNNSLKAYGLMMQFLSMICDKSAIIAKDNTPSESKLPQFITDILAYIDKNLTQIESVEQLAHRFGISCPYLSTSFKKHIGTSIAVYIQTNKIALAKELLDKNYSVTDACYESGFNDCSYFIKTFKHHTGVTPLRYAKNPH